MTWLLIKDSFYVRGRPGMMHKKNWDNTVVKKKKTTTNTHCHEKVMQGWMINPIVHHLLTKYLQFCLHEDEHSCIVLQQMTT